MFDDFFDEQHKHASRSGDGWHGRIFGACPVQGYGECDGVPWYFRSRCGWSVEFGVSEGPDGHLVGDPIFTFEGEDADGWISAAEAWTLIEQAISEFRAFKNR